MTFQRVLSLTVTFIETLLYTGLLYGWSSLQPVLVQEGFFNGSDCENNETEYFTYYRLSSEKAVNTDQISQLEVVFTIASTIAPICNLSTGYMLDRLGGWFTRTYCLTAMATGLILCSVATPETSNLLFVSFSLISYAGLGLNTVNVQVANFLPKYKSSLCTIISGLYDSSTLVFLVFNKLYKNGSSYNGMFLVYAFLSIPFHFYTFLLTPKRPPPEKVPDNYSYGYHELPCIKQTIEETVNQSYKRFGSKKEDVVDISFKECLKLPYTWTNILHSCVLQLSMAFFIGNFNFWLSSSFPNTSSDQIEKYTTIFGTVQCCGVFFAPVSGILMDFLRQKYTKVIPMRLAALKSAAVSILLSSVLTILMFVFSLVPIFEFQIVTFIMQALARSIICGTLSAFLNIVYPNKHYGKMYGIHVFVCGLFLLLQYPLTLAVTNLLNNSFTVVNAVLLVLCVTTLAHPFYILYYVKQSIKLENSLLRSKIKHKNSSNHDVDVKESNC